MGYIPWTLTPIALQLALDVEEVPEVEVSEAAWDTLAAASDVELLSWTRKRPRIGGSRDPLWTRLMEHSCRRAALIVLREEKVRRSAPSAVGAGFQRHPPAWNPRARHCRVVQEAKRRRMLDEQGDARLRAAIAQREEEERRKAEEAERVRLRGWQSP